METTGVSARLLDGKATAAAVRGDVRRMAERSTAAGQRPGLGVILVGDDPASHVYVRNKDRAAEEAGFHVRTAKLAPSTRQDELLAAIRDLDADERIHGILVQFPLPYGLDERAAVRAISPDKDADGLHPENVARLVMGEPGAVPCTPAGCIELLDRHGIAIAGKRAVVIGRSMLVGKPLAQLLLARDATVTVCHSKTRDLPGVCRQAELLVAAVGRSELVRGDWVAPGAVVIDVGINRGADGKLRGDVAFDEVAAVASWITPVPGGVGPMTIAMLLSNTAHAAARRAGIALD